MEIIDDAVVAIMELNNVVCYEFPNFGETKANEFSLGYTFLVVPLDQVNDTHSGGYELV